jgi:hypothetical protein
MLVIFFNNVFLVDLDVVRLFAIAQRYIKTFSAKLFTLALNLIHKLNSAIQ